MKVDIVQAAEGVNKTPARGLEGIKPVGPSDGGAPKQAPTPGPNSTGDVAFRLSVNPEKPPQQVVTNAETGQAKPLVPDNPKVEQAINRQIAVAKSVVASSPPVSPVPRAMNITA